MSSPSFVPERGEIWYSDGLSGFYAVRLTNGTQALVEPPSSVARRCLARRSPIGPRNIGRVRIGYSRGRLANWWSSRCGRAAARIATASRAARGA